ncbi:MAG: acyl-CoA synthetase [Rhodospirillales bacterium]|nr:acyl-CoA synthetase [Rhodospirillales bacterium]
MIDYPPIRDLADIEAIEKEPLGEQLGFVNVYDYIQAGIARDPDKIALYFHPHGDPDETPEIHSFGNLQARINQAANLFHDLGIGAEDKVSFLLPNMPALHPVLWGALAVGIASPINWMLEPNHIAAIIRAVGAKVLVALGPEPGAGPGIGIWDKVEAIKGDIPSVEHILQVTAPGSSVVDGQSFEHALADQPANGLKFERAVGLDDIAVCMHTGGTTGAPKITANTHRGVLYQNWASALGSALQPDDTVWTAGPSFHIAVVSGGALTPLALGMTMVNPGPLGFRHTGVLANYWKLMERYGITRLYGVPTILSSLVHIPVDGVDMSRLRFSTSSSSPLPLEVSYELERLTGLKIGLNWGLTENTASLTCHPRDGEIRHGSSGLRRPYTHIRAVRTDADGTIVGDCTADEIGTFFIKGPGLIPGYLDPSFDAGAFTEDGWFNTGDMGRIEADGYIWVTGRTKDLIIRGGHNIDPRLIEEPLYAHQAVELAGAVGKPDPRVGELPVAYVQLKQGASADADELKAFIRERVTERAANPADIFIIDEMPLTGVGKVMKQALRLDAARRTFEDLLRPLVPNGVTIALAVDDDPVHGTRAIVTLGGEIGLRGVAGACVEDALAAYALHHEIIWN